MNRVEWHLKNHSKKFTSLKQGDHLLVVVAMYLVLSNSALGYSSIESSIHFFEHPLLPQPLLLHAPAVSVEQLKQRLLFVRQIR